MRSCNTLGSTLISGGLLALLAVGCGHAISPSTSNTAGSGNVSSTGGSANGGAGVGGGTAACDNFVEVIQADAGTTAGGAANGTCSATAGVPCEASRPGYLPLQTDEQKIKDLMSQMTDQNKIDQMYGIPDTGSRAFVAFRDIERSQNVTLKDGTVVRGFEYRDAGRGANLAAGQDTRYYADPNSSDNFSTAFPPPSTRAASWDVELEANVGEAMGDEVMGSKNNLLLAPCMNLLRHPYWGRSQETYGEDVYQVGRMATALTVGLQKHVIACAKHYAANNIENGRINQNVTMDEQTLREIFTRHFGMVVQDGGVGCVMAAYNLINKTKCTQNPHLLRDILKGPESSGGFGFQGFVISDWWAMPDWQGPIDGSRATAVATEALAAGLDDEVPWSIHYSQLKSMLDQEASTSGHAIQDQINEAATRVVRQKVRFNTWSKPASGTDNGPYGLGTPVTSLTSTGSITNNDVKGSSHLDLAEEADIRSKVLLNNGLGGTPVLPVNTNAPIKIAVVGVEETMQVVEDSTEYPKTGKIMHFATDVNIGDRGSSRVNADPALSIGPFDGIQEYVTLNKLSNVTVTHSNTADAAANADFVVVVVGLSATDEGEEYSIPSFGDRSSLDMPLNQADFVSTVLGYNKPTVILVESGSVVNIPWVQDASHPNQATIWAGYGGQHVGRAYAKLLFGARNFSGKMAVSWPTQAQLDTAAQADNGMKFRSTDGSNSTTEDYFFGYRYWDKFGITPLFPFGAGISYSTFKYSNLHVPCGSVSKTGADRNTGFVNVTVDVENKGPYDGDEIVMLFVKGPQSPAGITGKRPIKELKRFQRVNGIKLGSKVRVSLPLSLWELRHWEEGTTKSWVIDSGDYTIMVGKNFADPDMQTATLTVQ